MHNFEIKTSRAFIVPAAPPYVRRAVIDVGTNSVKLLVADVDRDRVVPVFEASEQTRLGRGFYESHILQSDSIALTAEAIKHFAGEARACGTSDVRVIATSAARDARNAAELLSAVRAKAGLEVEVISGEQEADWAFQGVTRNSGLSTGAVLILDVGGGSTEFILGEHGHAGFRESFQLGTVRLLEQRHPSDPPTSQELAQCRRGIRNFLLEKVQPKLDVALVSHSAKAVQLVGTGGTATLAARIKNGMTDFDREKIETTRLTQAEVSEMTERFWKMTLAERQQVPGLPKNRADVILMGMAIYEGIMQQFTFGELRVSTRGLRYAALMQV